MDSISLGSWAMDSISLYRDPRTGTKLKVTGLLGIVSKETALCNSCPYLVTWSRCSRCNPVGDGLVAVAGLLHTGIVTGPVPWKIMQTSFPYCIYCTPKTPQTLKPAPTCAPKT